MVDERDEYYKITSRMDIDGVLLYSGGIDSYITYHYLTMYKKLKPLCVYFQLENSYSWFEEDHIERLNANMKVRIDPTIRIGDLEQSDFHIPMRNVILMTMAAVKYNPNVWIGSVFDDNSPDGNEKVFKNVSRLLNQVELKANVPFDISAPLQSDGLRKSQACRWYVQNIGTGERLTRNSASCFKPIRKEEDRHSYMLADGEYKSAHCFSCACCFRRNCALYDIGVELPFFNEQLVKNYKTKFEQGKYDIVRTGCSLKYINWLNSMGYVNV